MTPAGKATDKFTRAATERATGLLQGVRARVPGGKGGDPGEGALTKRQTLTFHQTGVETLVRFFKDPVILSEIGGSVASVEPAGDIGYAWRLSQPGGADPIEVATTLHELPGLLRWTAAGDGDEPGHRAELRLTPAPRDLGTEVTFEVEVQTSPLLPDTLTGLALGGAMYKALYRARALAQTSELPTLRHNPAARDGADHDED